MGDIVKLKKSDAASLIDDLSENKDNIESIVVAYTVKDGSIFTYRASSLMEMAVLVAYLDISLKEEL